MLHIFNIHDGILFVYSTSLLPLHLYEGNKVWTMWFSYKFSSILKEISIYSLEITFQGIKGRHRQREWNDVKIFPNGHVYLNGPAQ